MNKIDVVKAKKWPQFEAFLNQLIQKYESESSRPKMRMNQGATPIFELPTEADISIRGYSLADTVESTTRHIAGTAGLARAALTQRRSRVRGVFDEAADDLRDGLVEGGGVIGETLGTGQSTFGWDINDLARGDGEYFGKGTPVVEDVIEWFRDCYHCDGRIEGTLMTDLTLPEILLEMGDFLGDLEDIINTAIDSFDSSRALARMCAAIPMGKWCIPDLTAFLAVLAALLQQYWLVDPTLEFSWFGIVSALLYPILQAAYSILGMGLNLSLQPVDCLLQILADSRRFVEQTRRLDHAAGYSLAHLQATMMTTLSNDRAFSREVLESLRGKIDWAPGDSLLGYSEVLNLLSPIEVGMLSLRDFQFKLTNLAQWFSSRLRALRAQSRETAFAMLKFTNIMYTLGRLYSFVDALKELVVHGKEVCQEKVDDDGNLIFILAKPVDEIYLEAGVVPPWVTFDHGDSEITSGDDLKRLGPTNLDQEDQDETLKSRRSFAIIDNSLGTKQVTIGCLGQVSEEDQERVERWINELDGLSQ